MPACSSTRPEIAVISGAGSKAPLSGDINAGRYLFSDWHNATNRGFIVNQGNSDGTSGDPGSVVVVDGATETVAGYAEVPPNPFGIGIDQVNNRVYVGTPRRPAVHGQLAIIDAMDPLEDAELCASCHHRLPGSVAGVPAERHRRAAGIRPPRRRQPGQSQGLRVADRRFTDLARRARSRHQRS